MDPFATQPFGLSVQYGWSVLGPIVGMGVLLVLGVPIWTVLGLGTVALLSATQVLPLSLIGETLFNGLNHFALIAVPLFVLTGDAVVVTRLSDELLGLAEASLGWIRSGLGTATVIGCGFFAFISGSDAADAAALGRVTLSRLVEKGYPMPYACALVASGACTGILIPPSIAYIILGLVLGISASTLFLAAVIPGLLILLAVILTNIVLNQRYRYEDNRGRFSLSLWARSFWRARYGISIPIIILGGIYSGTFTPTESAAVAVATTAAIGFLTGRLRTADFPRMMERSALISGVIAPIIAIALLLAQALASLNVPQSFVQALMSLTDNRALIILLMLVIFLLAGCVLETTPNIVILAPLLLPVAQRIGLDPIHFSVFMVTALGIGFITPPVGLNLFVVSGLTGTPVLRVARYALPFVVTMILTVLLLGFVPALSLWAVR